MKFFAPVNPKFTPGGAFLSKIADTAREYQFYFDRLCKLFGPPNDPLFHYGESSKKYRHYWTLKHKTAQGTIEIYTRANIFRVGGTCSEKVGELLELIDPEAFAGFGALSADDIFCLNFPPEKNGVLRGHRTA